MLTQKFVKNVSLIFRNSMFREKIEVEIKLREACFLIFAFSIKYFHNQARYPFQSLFRSHSMDVGHLV